MAFNPFAICLVVAACVILSTEVACLTKMECTKCRLDVYSFGSREYDCGISRHNSLPICAVECKKEFDMTIPIPNLTLEFDTKTCVASISPTTTTTTTPTAKTSTNPATPAPITTQTLTPGPSVTV